jgi:hypothetical protein
MPPVLLALSIKLHVNKQPVVMAITVYSTAGQAVVGPSQMATVVIKWAKRAHPDPIFKVLYVQQASGSMPAVQPQPMKMHVEKYLP